MKKTLVVLLILAACTRVSAQMSDTQASEIILDLSRQKTMYLARQQAQYWSGWINGYINVLQTLSNIMNFYENLPAAERRQTYENTIISVFENMPDFAQLGTIWKPNAIDGQDARNIGRAGSTPTGQFAFTLSRETGQIVKSASSVVQETMAIINGSKDRLVSMSDPVPFRNQGKDTFVVRITCPIINKRINEVVGAIICHLDIAMIQPRIESTIKNFDEVTSMVIYTENGFVLANYLPEFIGKHIDTETQYGAYLNEVKDVIKKAYEWEETAYDPELRTNMVMAVTYIPIRDSPTTWSVMIGSTEAYIMRDVTATKVMFPSDFAGNWKRSNFNNILSITENTMKSSNRNFLWVLQKISGNAYTLKRTDSANTKTITFRLDNKGNLVIGGDSGSGENNWNGTWLEW
jgi:methyl-accepting chemotaxis protein